MSIFAQLFGSQNPQPQQQAQPQQPDPNDGAGQPGNIPPAAAASATGKSSEGTAPNGTIPAGGAPGSPLDAFADLWKNDPATDGQNSDAFTLNIDPKKIFEAAGKTDFSRALNQELMQKIAGGGEDAVKAMAAVMNSVAQASYGQSTVATAKIVEQALAAQQEKFTQLLPNLIKQHQVSDNLSSENPIFNNPAVQPIMDALKSQLAVKHPQATAGQLTEMAKKYVGALGTSFSPAPKAAEGKSKDYDWSEFLN